MQLKRVESEAELRGIRALQEANLARSLTPDEAAREGFVTAAYTPDFFLRMHQLCPSVVATEGGTVVGYALAAVQELRGEHELLASLFDAIDRLTVRGQPLAGGRYVVVGQLCVAKSHRGQGLSQRLYGQFRASLQGRFDRCLTDVARANPGSLRAHLKAGFEVVDTLRYGGTLWDVVLWEWTGPAGPPGEAR